MNNLNRNKTTSLFELRIGEKTFTSEDPEIFCISLTDIEKLKVADLPPDVTFQLNDIIDDCEISFVRKDTDVTEIYMSEFGSAVNWDKYISINYYYILKEELILIDFFYHELFLIYQFEI